MNRSEQDSSVVRKIVTVNTENELNVLKKVLQNNGGRIVKELPLVQAFLCEFPEENTVSIATRDLQDNIKIDEDIDFKLCCLSGFGFAPFMPFPKYKPVYQQPKKESTPITPGRRIDWGLTRIGAPEVWPLLTDKRVRVGIIDTGIDKSHPDLRRNLRDGISTLDSNLSFEDDYGHGTHVAGTIGASNSSGMIGINPNVDFFVVKAFDKNGSGKLSDIIEGLDWLIRRQVNVINMSFSTNETSHIFERAINYAYRRGTVLVAASGNDGGSNSVNYPAKFREVIAVSATDNKDQLADFASTGPQIDFCAPGVNINSSWINGGYAVKSGTSFAAPHITGTIADIINYYGYLSPQQIRSMMANNAVRLEKLSKIQQGAGLVELPKLIYRKEKE